MTKSIFLLAAALAVTWASTSAPPSSSATQVVEEPPQYTGPCSNKECGASLKPCRNGLTCVPYPYFPPGPRYGCTCSYM
ncbi:hypothetical protein B0T16DRAFT_402560 [Cercophora newfieldiana]|uniref:Secreted protein n=1 Tax=Cercophora newfieldiana TaxID=92897 RepID=A0AA39YUN4_9PEZI|nr:hypothetical protein B0T16DRAFT_402560 [Cercophora newfieldiana]